MLGQQCIGRSGANRDIEKAYGSAESFQGFDLAELLEEDSHANSFDLASRPVPAYPNQFGKLGELIKGFRQERIATLVALSPAPPRSRLAGRARLHQSLRLQQVMPQPLSRLIEQNTPVALKARGNAELEGLQLPAWRIALVTDREFFGQQTLTSSGYVRRRKAASRTVDPNKMRPGDFVVHRNHGIGRFKAMEKLAISGDIRDYRGRSMPMARSGWLPISWAAWAGIRATSETAPAQPHGRMPPGPRPRNAPRKPCARWRWTW